jgi:hypothetical protein
MAAARETRGDKLDSEGFPLIASPRANTNVSVKEGGGEGYERRQGRAR